ncbi:hypothetical protein D8674_007636 [Pyrus ussuriensis x Pyrus communis]|uniref:Uncharacterized protein n=1 Tax=Pyrus ussuriensis x Pyrus communis TaxID=2448454 RepID=A0A5N5HTD9_9ROSA|nr:hypothetical protein D8674_007636 [Pyrus ussuriensis x Pyrus communis]
MDKSSSKLALLVVFMVIASGLELCAEARNIADPYCKSNQDCLDWCGICKTCQCLNRQCFCTRSESGPLIPISSILAMN